MKNELFLVRIRMADGTDCIINREAASCAGVVDTITLLPGEHVLAVYAKSSSTGVWYDVTSVANEFLRIKIPFTTRSA
jgi:hypothetical protein